MTTDKSSEKSTKPVGDSKLAKTDNKETDPKGTKKPVEEVEDLVILFKVMNVQNSMKK